MASWLIVLLGYLLGAIPTAYIASRRSQGRDIRQMGDGNMGAANAYRELGARVGLIVFFIDVLKGFLAVLITRLSGVPETFVLLTGVAAVIGHNWSPLVGFRGGRGVSVTIGVLLNLVTVPFLIVIVPAAIVMYRFRNATLTSAFLFIPLWAIAWLMHFPVMVVVYCILLPCLVGFTHFLRARKPLPSTSSKP